MKSFTSEFISFVYLGTNLVIKFLAFKKNMPFYKNKIKNCKNLNETKIRVKNEYEHWEWGQYAKWIGAV